MDKFKSRKYRFVKFWNVFMVLTVIAQVILSSVGSDVKLPVLEVVMITGTLTGGYFGVNLLSHKLSKSKEKTNG